jgi:putative transposase
MDYGEYMNRRLHGWGFAKLHAQIRYKAVEKGTPVETVNPRNISKECHACGEVGYRPRQTTFKWTNDACWMGEYQADVNGTLSYPPLKRWDSAWTPVLATTSGRRIDSSSSRHHLCLL